MPVSKYSVDIDPDANTSHAVMLQLIGGSKRVLDVGCAAGDLARALVARGCTVSGVEVDASAAEAARPFLEHLVVGDLATMDLPAELAGARFDVVVFGDVLEHLVDPLATLRQARDLLAPGGYVVISIPNIAHASVRLALLNGEFTYRPLGLLDETHVRFFTRETLYRLLHDAALAPADVRRTTAGPFATELGVRPEDVPPAVVSRVLEDPDAETYQFVLTAVPDDADAHLFRAFRDHELAQDRILTLERELAQGADTLSQVTRELELSRRAEAAAVDELRAAREQLSEVTAELDHAEQVVAAMTASTSWRVSAPVRALAPARSAMRTTAAASRSLRAGGGLSGLARRIRERGISSTAASVRTALHAPYVEDAYRRWVAEHDTLTATDRAAIRSHIAQLPQRPLLSVIVPAYNTDAEALREAVGSVLGQLYEDWELCVVDDASPDESVWRTLSELTALDGRIRAVRREENGGIAAATNDALEMARGQYVVLLDHDDLLPPHALYLVALEILQHPDVDLIYSDEDKLDGDGRRYGPYFKPDFNHELLLGQNMISHLGVYRTALLREIGGLRAGYEGSQDHDLALRVVSSTTPERIRHIPRVLYHWRQYTGSGTFSSSNPDKAAQASRRAVADHLQRLGESADVVPAPVMRTWNRIVWTPPDPLPEVVAIVPTRDRLDLLRVCLEGLLDGTDYPALRVVVADNDSSQRETLDYLDVMSRTERVEVVPAPGDFNYSAINNLAVAQTDAPMVLLLNNDIVVREPGWLREMVALASRPGIGAVGAKLLFPNELVQHAGVVLGLLGAANHAHKFVHNGQPGYSGRLHLLQEFSAVTGACLLTRREAFDAVGGLDADHLPVAYNDIDYCLRLREKGWRTLWTPHAELVHLESMSRGSEEDQHPGRTSRFDDERAYFVSRWGPVLAHDPAYNPNLTLSATDFSLAERPRLQKPWAAYLA